MEEQQERERLKQEQERQARVAARGEKRAQEGLDEFVARRVGGEVAGPLKADLDVARMQVQRAQSEINHLLSLMAMVTNQRDEAIQVAERATAAAEWGEQKIKDLLKELESAREEIQELRVAASRTDGAGDGSS